MSGRRTKGTPVDATYKSQPRPAFRRLISAIAGAIGEGWHVRTINAWDAELRRHDEKLFVRLSCSVVMEGRQEIHRERLVIRSSSSPGLQLSAAVHRGARIIARDIGRRLLIKRGDR